MKKYLILLSFSIFSCVNTLAQTSFPDACVGTWKGMMYIYSSGNLKDSVSVILTVAKTTKTDEWIWKTEYLSPKMPIIKDYKLRVKDASKNIYVTDEGGGIELVDYLFDRKLYNVFETHNIVLTSTYELRGNELIFEVTSGKKETTGNQEVINYSVDNLQKVIFRKDSK